VKMIASNKTTPPPISIDCLLLRISTWARTISWSHDHC
jgi:hypothetical protein